MNLNCWSFGTITPQGLGLWLNGLSLVSQSRRSNGKRKLCTGYTSTSHVIGTVSGGFAPAGTVNYYPQSNALFGQTG